MDLKILLVEDDPKLGQTIKEDLVDKGYQVDIAFDGKIAQSMYAANKYDMALLDINVPYVNGWELCKIIRNQNKDIPIIMLTALGEIEDKMEAFNAGADDYLVKPFHLNELVARLKVFMKRIAKNDLHDDVLTADDLILNASDRTVKRADTEINLTTKEFLLLELLMRNKSRVVSKSHIAEKIWNINFETGTNTIEVYINFLRNKVDKPFNKNLIQTKPGFGYMIKE